MKRKILIFAMLLCNIIAYSQSDPIVMTIGKEVVLRSEFEYSYNKNNGVGALEKKSVSEFANQYVDYKLKVLAAKEAGIDTLKSLKNDFSVYSKRQSAPQYMVSEDTEREARAIYRREQQRVDALGGMIKPAQIFIKLKQTATRAEQSEAKKRIDLIYDELRGGADFGKMARNYSDDKESAAKNGEMEWTWKGLMLPDFEDVAFSLNKGEMSKPFLAVDGYHIVLLVDKSNYFSYETRRPAIVKYIEQRNLRRRIIEMNREPTSQERDNAGKQPIGNKNDETVGLSDNSKYLTKEYQEGLLIYEMSSRMMEKEMSKGEANLKEYFRKNKKKYRWTEPRFKGIAFFAKSKADVKMVRRSLKDVTFDRWESKLNEVFNGNIDAIKDEKKGLFKRGDNKIVDIDVFKDNKSLTTPSGYPYYDTYGKKLKAPKDYNDVSGIVMADYQEELEKTWLSQLKKKYPIVINKEVLATVNKH